jgi:hypothetical protein
VLGFSASVGIIKPEDLSFSTSPRDEEHLAAAVISSMKLKAITISLKQKGFPKHLTLGACNDADKEMEVFLKVLQKSKLERICVRTDFLTQMSEANALLCMNTVASLPSLRQLDIQSSSRFHIDIVPHQALLPLRQAYQLETLRLEDFQVTAAHSDFMSSLSSAVESHPSLQEICLTNFFANDHTNTRPNVLDPLVWTLATIPNLTKLELTGCGSHALTGHAQPLLSPIALSRLLQKLTKLTTLCLEFLECQDDHFEAIASQIENNTFLTTLSLNYHQMKNAGFAVLMQSLANNLHIKTLNVRNLSTIGHDGFAHAMKMLRRNYYIETLSVTTATPSQQAEIDLYLRLNRYGRRLLRRTPHASMGQWIDVLAKCTHDVDATRHLLAEIPGLCHSAPVANPVA